MRERLYNGDFFNFDFYIERTEGVYDGIDYEEAFKAFTYHILHESGPIEIGVDLRNENFRNLNDDRGVRI